MDEVAESGTPAAEGTRAEVPHAVTTFHLPRPPDPVLTSQLARSFAADGELRLTAEDVEALTQ